jgi:hypothetical protein
MAGSNQALFPNEGGCDERRHAVIAGLIAGLLAVPASAMANNDPFSPGDNCSGNPQTIGQHPIETPGFTADAAPVDGVVAAHRPHPTFSRRAQPVGGINATEIVESLGTRLRFHHPPPLRGSWPANQGPPLW